MSKPWEVSQEICDKVQAAGWAKDREAARLLPLPKRNGNFVEYAKRVFNTFWGRAIAQDLDASPMAFADLAAYKALKGIHFVRKATYRKAQEALKFLLQQYWIDSGQETIFVQEDTKDFLKHFGKYVQ